MVDAASRIECATCKEQFQTTCFYDHISLQRCSRKNKKGDEFTLSLEDESLIKHNPVIYESVNNFEVPEMPKE